MSKPCTSPCKPGLKETVAGRTPARAKVLSNSAKSGGRPVAARGAIVSVGSRGAYRGEPSAWAYAAAKAALHATSSSAAVSLGRFGVVCAAVAPGFIATQAKQQGILAGPAGDAIKAQSSWGRVAAEEEVADAVAYLARFWVNPWVTGTVMDLNGASYLH